MRRRSQDFVLPRSVGRFYWYYLVVHPWWLVWFALSLVMARVLRYSVYPLFSKYVVEWIENPPVADVFQYALPYLVGFAGVVVSVTLGWIVRYHYEQKIEEFARMDMGERLQN